MKVTEVRYTRRYNTAKYEHEEYTASASLDEGENPVEAVSNLKEIVQAAHEGVEIPWEEKSEKSNTPNGQKSGKKAQTKSKKADEEEDDDVVEETDEEVEEELADTSDDDDDDETDDTETIGETDEDDDDADAEEEEKKPVAKKRGRPAKVAKSDDDDDDAKPAATGKSFRKKGSTYSRDSDIHKKLFAEALNKAIPGILKNNAGRAKTISLKMEGKEFLDANGRVLDSFVKEITRMAKAKVA